MEFQTTYTTEDRMTTNAQSTSNNDLIDHQRSKILVTFSHNLNVFTLDIQEMP